MSTQETAPPDPRQGSGPETCSCCGQQLLTEEAVRQLRQSELEFERRVDAAARARVAELANELVVELEAEHPEKLERPPGQRGEEEWTTANVRYARAVDKLRMAFRQF